MVIKSMIRKMVKWAFKNTVEIPYPDQPVSSSGHYGGSKVSSSSRIGESATGLNLTIYAATGGKVVQFNTYDPTRDRVTGGLYIVTDQEDLGQELGLIITREQLTR